MKSFLSKSGAIAAGLLLAAATFSPPIQAATPTPDAVNAFAIDNFFLFICAVLVLFMQAGFALVETGLNSAKNTVNILFKNLMDLSIGAILFYFIGYGLMYPGEAFSGGFFGFGGSGISADMPEIAGGKLYPAVDFLFQVAFAATAATIVSGAVAGRMQFKAYLIYSAVISAVIYPISGFWLWGGGWLKVLGFHDFAGSLLVHALGGFAGLAGAIVLGPRIGRFNEDGSPNAMPGHNLALSTLGVFILLIGWYGFNPGSQLAVVGADNTAAVMKIAVNTTLAACAGAVMAMIFAWSLFKKPDLTMALNGMLAGLVAITANCDVVSYNASLIIGAVGGILVVLGIMLLDKLRIDDPVGAWPVHGLNGIWGGVAAWLFGAQPMVAQLVGSLVVPLWGFVTMLVLFLILKAVGILRVHKDEEMKGLDISEHEEEAYFGFDIYTTQ
ncbi:ammonium transporter [Chlorobaculum sp. 24CR]|uniref:ammonium transporter n=1 Tax=Chlorobaculum sp. 24CR TaxID=2508878 RepID=UPI00100B72C1|nr:ammonium transporter [Chlorobaculum sp. 24CR]RXK84835.1 ammonium transporter [Chlorobaculum sp. 24CR]